LIFNIQICKYCSNANSRWSSRQYISR